jgi:hypothetical protein
MGRSAILTGQWNGSRQVAVGLLIRPHNCAAALQRHFVLLDFLLLELPLSKQLLKADRLGVLVNWRLLLLWRLYLQCRQWNAAH